jgi:hypothetical protein
VIFDGDSAGPLVGSSTRGRAETEADHVKIKAKMDAAFEKNVAKSRAERAARKNLKPQDQNGRHRSSRAA